MTKKSKKKQPKPQHQQQQQPQQQQGQCQNTAIPQQTAPIDHHSNNQVDHHNSYSQKVNQQQIQSDRKGSQIKKEQQNSSNHGNIIQNKANFEVQQGKKQQLFTDVAHVPSIQQTQKLLQQNIHDNKIKQSNIEQVHQQKHQIQQNSKQVHSSITRKQQIQQNQKQYSDYQTPKQQEQKEMNSKITKDEQANSTMPINYPQLIQHESSNEINNKQQQQQQQHNKDNNKNSGSPTKLHSITKQQQQLDQLIQLQQYQSPQHQKTQILTIKPQSQLQTQNKLRKQQKTDHKKQSIQNEQQQLQQLQSINSNNNSINRQQSLDVYMQLKYSDSLNESTSNNNTNSKNTNININKADKKFSKMSITGLVSIQDCQQIPSLQLQPSPRSHKPLALSLISYRTTTFMTVSTQIFTIRITNPNIVGKQVQIQRRYSDFAELYQQIFYNQPGYILYPFPQKSLQSFMKLKLGLTTQSSQKNQLIQKRMKNLQQFINWLANHSQLANSEEFQNFITPDDANHKYEQGRARLSKYVQEHKLLLNGSQVKNIIGIGKSVFSYFAGHNHSNISNINNKDSSGAKLLQNNNNGSNSPTTLNSANNNTNINTHNVNIQYENHKTMKIAETTKRQKQKLSKLLIQSQLLLKAQQQFAEFVTLNTQNDFLLKICAKHSSGREYSRKWANFIQIGFKDIIALKYNMLEETEKRLIHRAEIIQAIVLAKSQGNGQRKAKLQRMLQRAERNFQFDWICFQGKYYQEINNAVKLFKKQWEEFKQKMRKIWKPTAK